MYWSIKLVYLLNVHVSWRQRATFTLKGRLTLNYSPLMFIFLTTNIFACFCNESSSGEDLEIPIIRDWFLIDSQICFTIHSNYMDSPIMKDVFLLRKSIYPSKRVNERVKRAIHTSKGEWRLVKYILAKCFDTKMIKLLVISFVSIENVLKSVSKAWRVFNFIYIYIYIYISWMKRDPLR